MKNKFYITTTLPYVNAEPHIGTALEFIHADAYARYFRNKLGKENVLFNIGTDEHGTKVYKKAKELNKNSIEEIRSYVEDTAQRLKKSALYSMFSMIVFIKHPIHIIINQHKNSG